ncbi:hypothetical protein XENORESO_018551 [Xenotaenia resolanae]|uniref:Uncharacterized protein n=1 Tax=Xenotaenia resolanae TaxID=208358 RepID=A0ABV0WG13_9TELE
MDTLQHSALETHLDPVCTHRCSDFFSRKSCIFGCMDTSSKTWLPHQGQFGLVGQAEVCCGGPGVLTPSESV